MPGPLTGMVPRPPQGDRAGSSYARTHPLAPPPVADPDANRLPRDPHNPRAPVDVPDGHLAVKLANAIPTSLGHHAPGDIAVLPDDEARALLRQGYAREVLRQ